jgi:hypothetical protein
MTSNLPPHGQDDLSEADRRAIADIRRELDAEFGPLEPTESSSAEPSPAPSAPRPSPSAAPPTPSRRRARVVPLFLLGVVLGGAVGGVTGGLTTLLWLRYADDRAARPPVIDRGAAVSENPAVATRESLPDSAALQSALNDWIDATRAGDIEGQMRFYPARVPVYYTWRDVTREAVREEKLRVFGAATSLQISTDTPIVELADGGRAAVSRFRKRYVIEGPLVRRRGEVLQELRWARTPVGWRIVAERDAEVLTPSASVGPDRAKRGGTIDPAR